MMDFLKSYYYGSEDKDSKKPLHHRAKSATVVEKKNSEERVQAKVEEYVISNEKDSYFPFPSPEMILKENGIYKDVKLKLKEKDGEFNKTKLFLTIVRQLSSGADLFRISLPANLLSPLSLLEYVSHLVIPTKELLTLHTVKNEVDRILVVTKWLMTCFSQIPNNGICHAKPLNPIIGEFYRCKYKVGNEYMYYFAEQVCHHPPKTAICLIDEKKTFALTGTILPKSKLYPNSAATCFYGELFFTIFKTGERYKLTMPWIVAYGTIWGRTYIEMNSHLKIKCKQNDLRVDIHYKTKSSNDIRGMLKRKNKKIKKFYGVNSKTVTVEDVKDDTEENFLTDKDYVTFKEAVKTQIHVPLKDQAKNESRRVWHRCIRALLKREFEDAGLAKKSIEQHQREKRKIRKKKKIVHQMVYFENKSEKKKVDYHLIKDFEKIVKSDKKFSEEFKLMDF